MKNLILTILSIIMSASFLQAAAEGMGWYDQDIWKNENRAFLWYPDAKKPRQTRQSQPQNTPVRNELAEFEMLQKNLDESRKIAVMNPTPQNLKRYIELQEVVMNKSAAFTDQWQRVIWQNPNLDYSQRGRPNNQLAQQQYDHNRQQQKAEAIRKLAGENGILFVFKSDCPYCHTMAPILKNFADQYGIKVMPVSLDGGGLNHFPRALPNNGIAQRLNVTTVPAMYVMDTKTKQFTPIGFGVMAQTTLEDRFLAYSRPVGTLY
ncbi:thioredoxin family protein [Neisseria subflava]|uniref:thioredoxin family protein n=1 Tax=Neisseria subflava TaxID=28449 RepID=UPI001C996AC9|nr:thioredoxin family protein [Neisseria subflava]MBY6286936.1 thioredoxin family protein [Neisseria subflava]